MIVIILDYNVYILYLDKVVKRYIEKYLYFN